MLPYFLDTVRYIPYLFIIISIFQSHKNYYYVIKLHEIDLNNIVYRQTTIYTK